MKYIIEIEAIEKLPENWAARSGWPRNGLFSCQGDTSLYHVYDYGVNYISQQDDFVKHPITDEELAPQVTELLFLKAIAAASRAEVLK